VSAKKTERLLNLVICLLATRRFLSVQEQRRESLPVVRGRVTSCGNSAGSCDADQR
jgi:hypothetical protein